MGFDRKYGKVTTEFGSIKENEPVVVFRAQDAILPKLLSYYHLFCIKEGCDREHLNFILDTKEKVEAWQSHNQTKIPDTKGNQKNG